MKANELKIGNYVHYKNTDYKDIPRKINYTCDPNLIGLERVSANRIEYNHIEPIKLNQDWLLKFGYSFQPWGCVKEGSPLIKFSLTPNEKYWIELGNGFRIELPYVHTLQNLTELTGGELTYEIES